MTFQPKKNFWKKLPDEQPPHLAHKISLLMAMKEKPEPTQQGNHVVFGFDDDDSFDVKFNF